MARRSKKAQKIQRMIFELKNVRTKGGQMSKRLISKKQQKELIFTDAHRKGT